MNLIEIHEQERVPLGDDDIRKHLGAGARIMTYPELFKYKTLKKLLPKKNDYIVLLYLQSPNSGHWVTIVRRGNTVEHFCSYGSKVDEPLNWISSEKQKELGVDYPKLTELFDNDTHFKKVFNHIDYQSEADTSVATCGKHVICRLKHRDLDLPHYYLLMTELKKKYKLPNYDDIVEALMELHEI